MASWASQGHGMRRRSDLPTNHHESAGEEMRERNHSTHHEAHEAAKAIGSARIPVGMDIYQATPAPALQGTLVPKQNTQSMDPTAGGKMNRVNVPYSERNGGQYRVTVPFTPTIDPAAGPTMQSAKVVPSMPGRQNPNFQSGVQYSNL